jgi:hypothetical protein
MCQKDFQVLRPRQPKHATCSEGNFQAYIEDLKKRKGPDADQPHRIKYRKLVR